jgi:Uma2 family endonuclease
MVAEHVPRGWTVDEYLRLELESPVKQECVDGHVYAMASGTQAHSELGVVAVALLRTLVRGGPCRAFNSDLKVHVSPRIYFYPDASVSCDPRDRHPDAREIQYPTLVLEVTSPSTADYDRGAKFDQYSTSASTSWSITAAAPSTCVHGVPIVRGAPGTTVRGRSSSCTAWPRPWPPMLSTRT